MRNLLIVAATLTALISGEAAAAKSSTSSTSTITYNNITYNYSSTSTCADGTAALRLYRKWWCSATSTTTTASTTSGTTSTTTTATTTTTPASYSANITWAIPTTRADGTPLSVSELAGYEVYYTNDSGSVSVSVPVSGGSTANTIVSSLASGNYYFSISAVDTSGLKSALSTVASVSLP